MKRFALVATAIVLVSPAACGGGADEGETRTSPRQAAPRAALLGPDETFTEFVRAAARGRARAAWALLSPGSRRRYGPTFSRFRADGFRRLRRRARPFRGSFDVVLAGRITERWGLAAATAGEATFGSALRIDRRRWTVELGGPIRVEAVRPEPGERVTTRTQIAAEVKAGARIEEAGLWLDGRALPARGGGLEPDALTMFAESGDLAPGRHSAVAFTSTARNAVALAWTFTARGTKAQRREPAPLGPA